MTKTTITITPDEENVRADALLAKRFSEHSRSYIQYLIGEGHVLYKEKPVKKREKIPAGSVLSIEFAPTKPMELTPEPLDLDIIYEDEHILAINKQYGVVVHPAAGNYTGTLIAGVLHYLGNLPECDDPLRPGVVHRLDKDTSGVMLIAKTTKAHRGLVESFKNREVKKTYVAITSGKPTKTHINAPVGRHPLKREMWTVKEDGKEAITDLQIAQVGERYAHVIVHPLTGRTHQIRVHLKSVNAPIVGDPIYANRKQGEDKLCLAATEITFKHPITEETITLTAPLPEHIEQKLKNLDK